ncbi:hypothetical protein MLD38_017286 [Melastoma candidum]|uniref:Uncharacterized protein n=1 Tax=Melastoma candidum TaxID=119954 RepID=A0ACB9QS29_9MYRT|nr:hypothetical protein MLD38_017286 [Melastoma candidum]
MFWNIPSISAPAPLEAILDKENFTLEELLDEDEIIQECKALNSRLINFLRDRAQVEQLLRYIIEEPPEDAEDKRALKFPFISCEIFTCDIDVIFKALVDEEELMDMLFSFLNPDRSHSALLAGYFSKVVKCLLLRKPVPLTNYILAHEDVFCKLVDLIGITSIMEVLIRLVGADGHVYLTLLDMMHWLADGDRLELIADKLIPTCNSDIQANAAETLCAISLNGPSALASKLASSSFVERVFNHALEDSHSKSGLVHCLSVCISLLDPKRSAISSSLLQSFRSQHLYEGPRHATAETINAMLPKLGELLKRLNLSSDQTALPTTYGELHPPLGKHRLKIVEFIAVLMRTGNDAAEKEVFSSGTIKRVIDLFFEYPFNNALHHQVESIILTCSESKTEGMIDHLFEECNLIERIVHTDNHPTLSTDCPPTLLAAGKKSSRAGNLGHITRISNKLVQMASINDNIQKHLKDNSEWTQWQANVLQVRNAIENVYRWSCGRPTALRDRTKDSDEDDLHDKDYDVAVLANNLCQASRYKLYGNDGAEEMQDDGGIDKDHEDVYFDDESAEVVISSLRLGDDHNSLFTNSDWFTFPDERVDNATLGSTSMMEEINLNDTADGGDHGSDDEVVVGDDEDLTATNDLPKNTSTSILGSMDGALTDGFGIGMSVGKSGIPPDSNFFRFEIPENEDLFGDGPLPEWVGWGESANPQIVGSSVNPFDDIDESDMNMPNGQEAATYVSPPSKEPSILPNGSINSRSSEGSSSSTGSDTSPQRGIAVPSLFEEDVEFVGVELEGTEKAMEQALKEGIVGEAGPLKRKIVPENEESDGVVEEGMKEFNDANYWRVEPEVSILE